MKSVLSLRLVWLILFSFTCSVLFQGCPPTQVAVPDLLGLTEAEATTALANAGFLLGTVRQLFDDATIGDVIEQCPVAGTSVEPGASVTVTVSKGVEVPDLVGLHYAAAKALLDHVGLALTGNPAYSATVTAGEVYAQSVSAGTGVAAGSTVDVSVSCGETLLVDKASPAAENDQDGLTWATAYNTLQEAINRAKQLECDIWVAAATYDEDRSVSEPIHGSVLLAARVDMYGGFDTADVTFADRDWEGNVTTISGANGNGVGMKAYNVVKGADHMVLDGFTITDGEGDLGDRGVGMFNDGASPTVLNCTFTNNIGMSDGGGMYNGRDAAPLIMNCVFSNNTAWDGGGMANDDTSSPLIINCVFTGNVANDSLVGDGGGMYNDLNGTGIAWPTIIGCVFTNNRAATYGGGMYNYQNESTIIDCVFVDNSAGSYGGGMHNQNASPLLEHCIFSDNTADYGGGMYNDDTADPAVAYCRFISNTAIYNGGGIANTGTSDPVITNTILCANTATDYGGALYSSNSTPVITNCVLTNNAAGAGGGTYHNTASPVFTNSILYENSGIPGPEICNAPGSPTVAYCCVAGGYDDGVNQATVITSSPLFEGSPLAGPATGESVSAFDADAGTTVLIHTGQFVANALKDLLLWVDTDNNGIIDTPFPVATNDEDSITLYGDASATTTFIYDIWDHHLKSSSPCIDTGRDTSGYAFGTVLDDMDDVDRPQDGDGLGTGTTGDNSDYDIGAFEYPGT